MLTSASKKSNEIGERNGIGSLLLPFIAALERERERSRRIEDVVGVLASAWVFSSRGKESELRLLLKRYK